MTTFREVITDALRAIKVLAPGDGPSVDELNDGLVVAQNVLLELHEARGPLLDVDVTTNYIAGENERVRIADGDTVTVSLPNAIQTFDGRPDTDYGFAAASDKPPIGSTGTPDGVSTRAPRDGTRIEIVGTTQATYFFRADVNQWVQADQRALDDLVPLSARYRGHFAALVARQMIDIWPDMAQPSPSLAARIGRANSALLVRPGVARDPVTSEYF